MTSLRSITLVSGNQIELLGDVTVKSRKSIAPTEDRKGVDRG